MVWSPDPTGLFLYQRLMTAACPYVEVLGFPPAKLTELQRAWACMVCALYQFYTAAKCLWSSSVPAALGTNMLQQSMPCSFGAPAVCVMWCRGGEQCFPGGTWGDVEEPVCSFSNPLTCSVQWNPSHEGFLGYRTITHSQYGHLPTFLMSHGSGLMSYGRGLMFQKNCQNHCEISHTHRVMSCESMCFPEPQGLATLCLSLLQIHEAVADPSFISNTGGIGWKAINLLRRHSVRLCETSHSALFSWKARYCVISPFYLFCFWCLQVCLGNFSSLPHGIKFTFL